MQSAVLAFTEDEILPVSTVLSMLREIFCCMIDWSPMMCLIWLVKMLGFYMLARLLATTAEPR